MGFSPEDGCAVFIRQAPNRRLLGVKLRVRGDAAQKKSHGPDEGPWLME
jgi:hypothetical protein